MMVIQCRRSLTSLAKAPSWRQIWIWSWSRRRSRTWSSRESLRMFVLAQPWGRQMILAARPKYLAVGIPLLVAVFGTCFTCHLLQSREVLLGIVAWWISMKGLVELVEFFSFRWRSEQKHETMSHGEVPRLRVLTAIWLHGRHRLWQLYGYPEDHTTSWRPGGTAMNENMGCPGLDPLESCSKVWLDALQQPLTCLKLLVKRRQMAFFVWIMFQRVWMVDS